MLSGDSSPLFLELPIGHCQSQNRRLTRLARRLTCQRLRGHSALNHCIPELRQPLTVSCRLFCLHRSFLLHANKIAFATTTAANKHRHFDFVESILQFCDRDDILDMLVYAFHIFTLD